MSTSEETGKLISQLLREQPWDGAPDADSEGGRRLMEAAVLLRRRQRRRRSPVLAGALSLAVAAGAAGWMGAQAFLGSSDFPLGSTIISPEGVEPTLVELKKGGKLEVQPASEVAVTESDTKVEVSVASGSLRVKTQPSDTRIWTVTAAGYAVGASAGSQLSVRMEPRKVTVDSESGQVRIEGPLIENSMLLGSGQRLVADRGAGEVALKTLRARQPAASVASVAKVHEQPSKDVAAVESAAVQTASSAPAAPVAPAVSWSKLIGAGKYAAVVKEAEKMGVSHCLQQCEPQRLSALALAGRYTGRQSLADQVWRAQRQRFPGTPAAADAAFFLGRQASGAGRYAEAVRWFDTYMRDSGGGRYTGDALGGKMLAQERSGQQVQARASAEMYLHRYPKGVHRDAARRILEAR